MNDLSKALAKIADGLRDLGEALEGLGPDRPRRGDGPAGGLDISGNTVEGRRRRQAIVLRAVEKAGGRIHWQDLYDVAESVGYDTRGLAGFSTKAANLLAVEREDGKDAGFRRLTEEGQRRLNYNRHLLPPE